MSSPSSTSTTTSSSSWHATALREIEAAAAANDASATDAAHIAAKLQQRLKAPPTALLACVLPSGCATDEQARQLLFAPSAQDMAAYAQHLLAGDPAAPQDLSTSAANRAQVLALTHLFLLHGKHWQRMRPFIAAGGLEALVALLGHANPVMAAQALALLTTVTHPDTYDWFTPQGSAASSSSTSSGAPATAAAPSLQQPGHPVHGPDGVLWQQLARLQAGPLLGQLLRLSPDVWPGSGAMALQLLAFYLCWLRRWWSKDSATLQLGAGLLSGLEEWSTRASASATEQQLAAELAADFGRARPAPALATADNTSAASFKHEAVLMDNARVVADRTQVNPRPGSEAERFKTAGNDAFKAGDAATAVQLYSAALDVAVPAEALLHEAPRRATYHSNRAAAYLQRHRQLTAAAAASSSSVRWREVGGLLDGLLLDGSDPDTHTRLLEAAILDCRAALQLVPAHAKAHYRLAAALRARGQLHGALTAAKAAQLHAPCRADSAAAASLAAAITQQQQEEQQQTGRSTPWSAQLSAAVTAAEAGGSAPSSTEPPVATACQPHGSTRLRPAGDAVGQLLQQLMAAVQQPGSSGGDGGGHNQPASSAAAAPAGVKLRAAVQADACEAALLLPGQASQQARPLIQVLSSCDALGGGE